MCDSCKTYQKCRHETSKDSEQSMKSPCTVSLVLPSPCSTNKYRKDTRGCSTSYKLCWGGVASWWVKNVSHATRTFHSSLTPTFPQRSFHLSTKAALQRSRWVPQETQALNTLSPTKTQNTKQPQNRQQNKKTQHILIV